MCSVFDHNTAAAVNDSFKGVITSLALHYWTGGALHITAQGCRLRNDLYCVEWDVKLYYTIPYHFHSRLN